MQLEVCLPDSQQIFAIVTIAYIYNHIPIRCFKQRIPQGIFLGNKPKTSYFCIFGYRAYVFLSTKVYANRLTLYSELMIFIGYEDYYYCFICYIQGNIIFCSIYAIFYERLISRYTESYTKEYNKLFGQSHQCLTLLEKMDLLQYLFHTYPVFPFKTILLLILLYFFLISLHLSHTFQSLKNLQYRLKRIIMLTLMLKYNYLVLKNL